jgi:hypothetical protein
MRSALAGTANNIVAINAAAVVPMSVIRRMFHLLLLNDYNGTGRTQFLKQ